LWLTRKVFDVFQAGVMEEMLNEGLDSALDNDDMEEEIEEEVDKVLSELAGETAAQLPAAAARKERQKQPAQSGPEPAKEVCLANILFLVSSIVATGMNNGVASCCS
jgi:hypothetical protein